MGQTAPFDPHLDRLLDKREVAAMLGVHWAHLDKLIRLGRFVPGIRVGLRKLGWRQSLVEAHIAKLENSPRPCVEGVREAARKRAEAHEEACVA